MLSNNTKWLIGALAAMLWIAPAAAQIGSTSAGEEHSYRTGNGTDPTRNNTDPDEAPASRAPGHARQAVPGTTSGTAGAAATAGTSATATADMAETLATLHQGNQQEIALGKLMEQKAQNSKVKNFAKKMVKDHSEMDHEVTSFAQKKRIDLAAAAHAAEAGAPQQATELQSMSGPQADRAYMDMMVQDHQHDVSEVKSAEQQAKSAHEKDLAKLLHKADKKMQGHLKDAQKIQHELAQRQARTPKQ